MKETDGLMNDVLTNKALFETGHTLAWNRFCKHSYPWEILNEINSIILEIGNTLDSNIYMHVEKDVWISKTAVVARNVTITGPVIIGSKTEVRPGAYLRGNVLIGENCVIGNSCELKNCILFDGVQVSHFNYVGDSVLGYLSHLGAGAVTSNCKSDHTMVYVKTGSQRIETNLRKFGAVLGDNVEVGCNAVLNPGTIICRNSRIYPASSVRGVVPPDSIFKSGNDFEIVKIKRNFKIPLK